jgi:hypothetical protein
VFGQKTDEGQITGGAKNACWHRNGLKNDPKQPFEKKK